MGYTPPTEIDIGGAAIARESSYGVNRTLIEKNNPANESGKITSVEVYVNIAMTNVEVATFYVISGNNLSTRDNEAIGNLAVGYHQINVNLNVETGDYIGIYTGAEGKVETDFSGDGMWYKTGDWIPCTNIAFSAYSPSTFSIYGTGGDPTGRLTIGESFSTVDSKVTKISKSLSEAFSIADSLVKNAIKQLGETFNLIDSWVARISFSEAFSVADSLVKNVTKQLGEVFSIADSKVTKVVKTLGEAFSVVDSFAHTIILHFYETLKIIDSYITNIRWIEVTKEKGNWSKVDKIYMGWLVSGWLIYGWLIVLWEKISKSISNFNKISKETSDWSEISKTKGEWDKVEKR